MSVVFENGTSKKLHKSYFDFGCYNYMCTLECLKCKALYETVITKRNWLSYELPEPELEFVLNDPEEMICLGCGTIENKIWNYKGNKCPKCKGEMDFEVAGMIRVRWKNK